MLFSNLLPSLLPIWMASFILIVVLSTFIKWPFISGALCGVMLVSFCFNSLFSSHESEIPVQKQFKAEIVSLVSTNSDWISFDIRVISEQYEFYHSNYRLTWQQPPEVKVGQVWIFTARMKPITSPLNQGGFNQQKYFLSRHIVAKGRVKQAELLDYNTPLRQLIINKMDPILQTRSNGAILKALLFGDKSNLTPTQWQQLRQTGTGHLVAISGLHLSVVFGLFWFIFRSGLQIFPSFSRRNLLIAMVLAALMATGYGYLAGFAIATQRALIMLLILIVLTMVNQYSSPWQRLIWALFAVLVIDPFASLSAGFWLSFSALAIILFTLEYSVAKAKINRSDSESTFNNSKNELEISHNEIEFTGTQVIEPNVQNLPFLERLVSKYQDYKNKLIGFWVGFWSIQWRLAIGLGLMQAILFGTISINSIWVNLLMVPWFSIVVIPLSIIALVLNLCLMFIPVTDELRVFFGEKLMSFADVALTPFQLLISGSDHWPMSLIHLSDKLVISIMLFILGIFLMMWAVNTLWRLAVGVLCIPLILYSWGAFYSSPSQLVPSWQVHVLDVGQGMAVLVQQGNRGLLYDTGAAYGDNFSYADRVIIPALNAKGISKLDYIIISHDDNDHAGGLDALMRQYPNTQIISDSAAHHFSSPLEERSQNPCTNRQFDWHGVTLRLAINPTAKNDNNRSCIAFITDGQHQVLLAGDIEKNSERYFTNNNMLSRSDILLAPHHGSRTSSTLAFIDAVSPQHVIFTAGFANQYGFPKNDVVERYKMKGVETLVSGNSGQISIDFEPSTYTIRQYRSDIAPFWYNKVFRFGEKVKAE
ncbi:DNA internalization-related competence protein ComEC/Rec2 [Shewanella sp. KT0246]|uniref:DNA internalization-related competence protein ComEC/Rec2 n=1 Tax=Shewanella sp. KT0246 TaxID=2815912 RepID=UPI001C7E0F65|nr:DNA internalization-related competence protein ComEC/Rec2 [Shewanella sp. KT0246]